MKKNIFLLFLSVTILLLCVGCSGKSDGPSGWTRDMNYSSSAYEDYAMAPSSADMGFEAKAAPITAPATIERMIVRNANLAISAFDPADAVLRINDIAKQMGGFVVTSSTSQRTSSYSSGESLLYGEATIRVQSHRLDEAIAAIEALTTDPDENVRSKSISGEDITSDYIDSQSRLTSMEVTRDKLYEIMDKAETAEDTLNVYMKISEIESDIEVLKGQLRYMEQNVALSSIYISIQQIPPERVVDIGGWNLNAIVKDAVQSLIDSGQFLLELLIYFVITWLPILLVIGIPLYLIIRAIVRKGKRKSPKSGASPSGVNSEISDLTKE